MYVKVAESLPDVFVRKGRARRRVRTSHGHKGWQDDGGSSDSSFFEAEGEEDDEADLPGWTKQQMGLSRTWCWTARTLWNGFFHQEMCQSFMTIIRSYSQCWDWTQLRFLTLQCCGFEFECEFQHYLSLMRHFLILQCCGLNWFWIWVWVWIWVLNLLGHFDARFSTFLRVYQQDWKDCLGFRQKTMYLDCLVLFLAPVLQSYSESECSNMPMSGAEGSLCVTFANSSSHNFMIQQCHCLRNWVV